MTAPLPPPAGLAVYDVDGSAFSARRVLPTLFSCTHNLGINYLKKELDGILGTNCSKSSWGIVYSCSMRVKLSPPSSTPLRTNAQKILGTPALVMTTSEALFPEFRLKATYRYTTDRYTRYRYTRHRCTIYRYTPYRCIHCRHTPYRYTHDGHTPYRSSTVSLRDEPCGRPHVATLSFETKKSRATAAILSPTICPLTELLS